MMGYFSSQYWGGGLAPNPDPTKVNCYFTIRDANMVGRAGVIFTFTLLDPLTNVDAWSQLVTQTATSDSTGLVQITLAVKMRWRCTAPDGKTFIDFTTPASGTFHIPGNPQALVGNF
jgi:hypothetical protein